MKPFWARYDPRFAPEPERLFIEVIGFRCRRSGIYSAPDGVPAWRVIMFHDPVSLRIPAGHCQVQAQTLFVVRPHSLTEYGRKAGNWSHSWIRFRGPEAGALIARHALPIETAVCFDSASESDTWLPLINRELGSQQRADGGIVRDLLGIWFRQIARRSVCDAAPAALLQARHHIETHYLEPIRLEELARRAHLSRQHFCEKFGRYFGITPINYVIQLRIQHAAELLGDINLNISEIAARSAFSDVFYFSRAFKKHMGQSPSRVRAARRGVQSGSGRSGDMEDVTLLG